MQSLLQQTWQLPAVTQAPRFSSSWPFPFVRLSKPHPSLFSSLSSQKLQVSKTGRGVEGKRIPGRILFIILSEQTGKGCCSQGCSLADARHVWLSGVASYFLFLSFHSCSQCSWDVVSAPEGGGGRKGQPCSYLFQTPVWLPNFINWKK